LARQYRIHGITTPEVKEISGGKDPSILPGLRPLEDLVVYGLSVLSHGFLKEKLHGISVKTSTKLRQSIPANTALSVGVLKQEHGQICFKSKSTSVHNPPWFTGDVQNGTSSNAVGSGAGTA
jgi:hypothetical protein